MSGNKASQANKPSKRTRQTRESSIGASDVSQKKNQNVADKETTANDSGRSKKKTKLELIYESPLVQEKEVTESLSFKRSRSGRLLVPTLEFWRNQRVVYDGDHNVIAFVEGLDLERTSSKGNKASQASKPGKRTRQTRESSIGVSDVSQKKNQNVSDKETAANDSGRSMKKTKRELIYEGPLVQEKEVTESLSFKRSRSGRLLVPTLEFWRNQRVVYDGDHNVIAFAEGLDLERTSSKVTTSEPRRKRED